MSSVTWEPKYLSRGNSIDEEAVHAALAAKATNTIVEIGVLNGHTTRIFLENSPQNVVVIGIDPIVPDSMNTELIGDVSKIYKLKEEYPDRFWFINNYSNVQYTKDQLLDYVHKNGQVDTVFVDGDHNYSVVKQDFEFYSKLVKIGGYISLHDSALNRSSPVIVHWPGSSRVADEIILNESDCFEYVGTTYCMTTFRKC